jgi:hypothetical protein
MSVNSHDIGASLFIESRALAPASVIDANINLIIPKAEETALSIMSAPGAGLIVELLNPFGLYPNSID